MIMRLTLKFLCSFQNFLFFLNFLIFCAVFQNFQKKKKKTSLTGFSIEKGYRSRCWSDCRKLNIVKLRKFLLKRRYQNHCWCDWSTTSHSYKRAQTLIFPNQTYSLQIYSNPRRISSPFDNKSSPHKFLQIFTF